MPLGIEIFESSIERGVAISDGISEATFFGTSNNTDAAEQNIPIAISSINDFETRFPGSPEVTSESIKLFFNNYSRGNLKFVNCSDGISADRQAAAHYTFALNELAQRRDLNLSYLVVPEVSQLTTQSDRTLVYTTAEAAAVALDWTHFINLANDTNTKTAAIAERNLYSSPRGHSACYYGFIRTADGRDVPISSAAAAVALRRAREENPYQPPAGPRYPINGASEIVSYVRSETDFKELRSNGINTIQFIPKIGYAIWSGRTLAPSTAEQFSQINTRNAINVIKRQLNEALQPLLISSSDPRGYTRREVIRVAASILQQAYLNGALSGRTPEQAYRFEEVEGTEGDLRKVTIRIYARFVETLEEIEIQLINVDVIPAAA